MDTNSTCSGSKSIDSFSIENNEINSSKPPLKEDLKIFSFQGDYLNSPSKFSEKYAINDIGMDVEITRSSQNLETKNLKKYTNRIEGNIEKVKRRLNGEEIDFKDLSEGEVIELKKKLRKVKKKERKKRR